MCSSLQFENRREFFGVRLKIFHNARRSLLETSAQVVSCLVTSRLLAAAESGILDDIGFSGTSLVCLVAEPPA